ncbi:MAG: T9SS type A sorting domain-containing protein [Bacteroidota bacterium]
MKKTSPFFGFFLLIVATFILPQCLQAATYTAVKDGMWHDDTLWDLGSVPGPLDDVVIDGYSVTFDDASGIVTVNSIALTNASGVGDTYLFLNGTTCELTVTTDFDVTSANVDRRVELNLAGSAKLFVRQHMEFTRVNSNNFNKRLKLELNDSAELTVDSTFTFYYGDAGAFEFLGEVELKNSSQMTIGGRAYFYLIRGVGLTLSLTNSASLTFEEDVVMQQQGGGILSLSVSNSADMNFKKNLTMTISDGTSNSLSVWSAGTVTIDSSLILSSTAATEDITVLVNGSDSRLEVKKDIILSAVAEDDVEIDFSGGGQFFVGGNFSRPTNFGRLRMSANAVLTYNGTGAQTVARETLPGSGTDDFEFTNVVFNNTSGIPITLEGPVIIADSLALTNGIIATDGTNSLTIGDGATITGGSSAAFISGPLIKQGSTNGQPFLFPIGNGGVYAPIEISAMSNATDGYTAQYYNCPPPFGNSIDASLDNISSQEYWSLQKVAGTPNVNVRLLWMDSDERGINNLDSLVVAYYNTGDSEWMSLGNGGTTGSVGASPGSVSNDLNCPPPFGNGNELFTIGSVDDVLNSLPVELTKFTANLVNKAVFIDWETTFEQDNDYFLVEHSADGRIFNVLDFVEAMEDNNQMVNSYGTVDRDPVQGFNYYRLKQVDLDGTFYYSEIIVVSLENKGNPILFPNPVSDRLSIHMGGTNQSAVDVQIYDNTGTQVFRRTYRSQGGVFQLSSAEIQNLLPGYYNLLLQNEYESHSMKFLKVN